MTPLEFHPYADLFPLIEGADFDALVADVAANGLHQPIDLWQGKILDGRNRYRAAQAAGLEIGPQNIRHFRRELYGDPLAYVISANLKRRHLDESQRALVAARIANLYHGGDRRSDQAANLPLEAQAADASDKQPPAGVVAPVSQDQAAQMLNVSPRLLRAAKSVQERAVPELRRAVERGQIAVSAAAGAVDLDADIQRRIAAEASAGRPNTARTVIKQERREKREADLGARQQSLPQKKFGIILADPEWRWRPWAESGMDRGVENTYPTTETTDIAARDVASIAADDCVLVLWAREDMLPDALQVIAAWGFCYVAQRVWRKSRMSTGYWFRYDHELVLIGKRGKPAAPAMGTQERSVFEGEPAVPGLNSSKPECVAEWIERNWPNTPKIELNRRGPARPGWGAWGNETEPSMGEPAVLAHVIADEGRACDPALSAGSPMDGNPTQSQAKADGAYEGCSQGQGPCDPASGGMDVTASRTIGGSDAPGVPSSSLGDSSVSAEDDGLAIPNFLRRDPVSGLASWQKESPGAHLDQTNENSAPDRAAADDSRASAAAILSEVLA